MSPPVVPAGPVVGDTMPDLALIDAGGRTSSLAAVRDGRPVIVHFMRSSTCPVCLAHAATIQRLLDAGQVHDAAFVLVPPGGAEEAAVTVARVRAARGTRAEVWASGTEHGSVGLGRFLGLQHGGTFVVDESGVLLRAHERAADGQLLAGRAHRGASGGDGCRGAGRAALTDQRGRPRQPATGLCSRSSSSCTLKR